MGEEWKGRLLACLACIDGQDVDEEKAFQIKYQHIPRRLYKYRTINDYSLDNLKNNIVWCSKVDSFNDPYDSSLTALSRENLLSNQFTESFQKSYPELQNILSPCLGLHGQDFSNELRSISSQFSEEFSQEISDFTNNTIDLLGNAENVSIEDFRQQFTGPIRDKLRVCPFSESFSSILMWSHYSDCHKGFVIEYDYHSLGIHEKESKALWPVYYSEKLFDISEHLNKVLLQQASPNKHLVLLAAIHKSLEWQYEKEWRLIYENVPESTSGNFIAAPVTRIYLGAKIAEADIQRILEIAIPKEIPIYKMELDKNNFAMTPNSVSL